MKGRVLSIVTAVLFALTALFSVPFNAEAVYADTEDPAISLGPGVLAEKVNKSDAQTLWYADNEWRVIGYDNTGTATRSGTVTLLSSGLLAHTMFGWGHNHYVDSYLKQEVDQIAETFSEGEKGAIEKKTLVHGEYDGGNTDCIAGNEDLPDVLLWPLSTLEVNGLNNDLRTYNTSPTIDQSDCWWLRSPGTERGWYAAFVYSDGVVEGQGTSCMNEHALYGVRPAFELDLTSILFTSAAENGKFSGPAGADALASQTDQTNSSSEWKATLKYGHDDFRISECSATEDGVAVTYTGAAVGTEDQPEYISAVITDKPITDSSARITYYGRIQECTSASGTVTIHTAGKLGENDTLYVFNEQYNGDKKTDYASALQAATPFTIEIADHTETYDKDGNPVYFYTGDTALEQHPTVTVKKPDGSLLTEGTEYTITYHKLEGAGEVDVTPIQPGEYVMVVSGRGGYENRINETRQFEIRNAKTIGVWFNRNKDADDMEDRTVVVYIGQVAPENNIPSFTNEPYILEGWYYDRACSENKKIDLARPLSDQFAELEELTPGRYYNIYAKWVHEHPLTKVDKKEATCAEAGYEEYWTCETCDKLFSNDTGRDEFEIREPEAIPIDPAVHEWGGWSETKAPTETEEGIRERECSLCHAKETESIPALVKNGWRKESGSWYYYDNGTMLKNAWKKDSKDWCYLGSDGRMVTNGWAKDSKGWCWLSSNGYWVRDKWIKDKGEWYYIKSNHYMAANEWAKDSVGWMYMASSGKITKSKWVKDGGYWYYLKPNGYMATGTLKIDGKTYTFDSSGKWIR